ncbi:hypothetical protein [Azospirillum largimobile]
MFPPRLPVFAGSSAQTGERTKKAPPRLAACWGFIASAHLPASSAGCAWCVLKLNDQILKYSTNGGADYAVLFFLAPNGSGAKQSNSIARQEMRRTDPYRLNDQIYPCTNLPIGLLRICGAGVRVGTLGSKTKNPNKAFTPSGAPSPARQSDIIGGLERFASLAQ